MSFWEKVPLLGVSWLVSYLVSWLVRLVCGFQTLESAIKCKLCKIYFIISRVCPARFDLINERSLDQFFRRIDKCCMVNYFVQ